MAIEIKRIYEPLSKSDGYRILVDRLWPRGMQKQKAHIDIWLKEIAPSTTLRKWFNHDPQKWEEFVVKYHAELEGSSVWEELVYLIDKHKSVTLLYGAKDEQYNQAEALKRFITGQTS